MQYSVSGPFRQLHKTNKVNMWVFEFFLFWIILIIFAGNESYLSSCSCIRLRQYRYRSQQRALATVHATLKSDHAFIHRRCSVAEILYMCVCLHRKRAIGEHVFFILSVLGCTQERLCSIFRVILTFSSYYQSSFVQYWILRGFPVIRSFSLFYFGKISFIY